MGEISEVERARRRLERASRPTNKTPAQSFRLGPDHMDKLRKLSQRSDVSQVELVRQMIDKRWAEVKQQRKSR